MGRGEKKKKIHKEGEAPTRRQIFSPSINTTAFSWRTLLIACLFFVILAYILTMSIRQPAAVAACLAAFFGLAHAGAQLPPNTGSGSGNSTSFNGTCTGATNVSLSWYQPAQYYVNSLPTVLNSTGVYGFIFNTSQGPLDTYDWCNMPHTNPSSYPRASADYTLEYVEVIHRHHKRTPYASNTFPVENIAWSCSDAGINYGGTPINPSGNGSAATYWNVYQSPSNPLPVQGFNGSCQFPQVTRQGLDDSWQHGQDLKAVYSDLLGFLSKDYNPNEVSYRVTNNVITSQVAAMLIEGMYPERMGLQTPLNIQPGSVDSLEPAYSCSSSSNLFGSYGVGSSNSAWTAHLTAAAPLFSRLDAISGVSPSNWGWHRSFDHYFDNLSAKLCHQKPLPCQTGNSTNCVSQSDAEEVFRMGEYEYSFIYRDASQSLQASTSSFGIFMAELVQNFRHAMGEGVSATYGIDSPSIKYRHNVAHDGSISRLLSILQIEKMVWPGMGSEVVFELYSKNNCYFLRILWGGQILTSSHPAFGKVDMIPIDTFLAYVDGLVGVGASKVPGLCSA